LDSFDPFSGLPVALHFADNLKRIKKLVIPWAQEKRKKEEQELEHLEVQIEQFYQSTDLGFVY
jgi:hypothetical protein